MRTKKWQLTGKFIVAVCVVLGWLVCVWNKCSICFETNDDRLISEILAGVVTVRPDGHAVYVHYFLAKPLSVLYRLLPGIAWYGLFLILAYGIVFVLLLNCMLRQCEKKRDYFTAVLVTLGLFLCTLQMLSMIQYTSTAAFVAIGGYTYLLLTAESGKKKYLVFFILEAIALLLRQNAMLMIQPMGLAVWFGYQLGDRHNACKVRLKRGLDILILIIAMVITAVLADKVVYRSPSWQEYMQFKASSEDLFDFYGKPPYDEVKDILDKYDVTQAEYYAYFHYTILDYDVSVECTRELVEYVKSNYVRENGWREIPRQIAETRYRGDFHGINVLVCVIWAFALAWIVMQRSFRLLWPLLGLKLGNTAVWYFMLWRGRTPWRVTAPIFICEIFFLAALLWGYFCKSEIKGMWRYVLLAGMSVLVFRYTYLTGQQQYRFAVQENENNEILIESMYEIEDYCRRNPRNYYLLGANSMSYFRGNALDVRLAKPRNSVVTGNWFSNSPSSAEYLQTYFGKGDRDLYLIVYEEVPIDSMAIEYLREKTGNSPVLADSFSTSSGAVYSVYYFGG